MHAAICTPTHSASITSPSDKLPNLPGFSGRDRSTRAYLKAHLEVDLIPELFVKYYFTSSMFKKWMAGREAARQPFL
jgi:hypothetical protein